LAIDGKLHPGHVLVVEDDQVNCLVIESLLASLGGHGVGGQ